MQVKISSGGERNVYVTASGFVSKGEPLTPEPIFLFKDIKGEPLTVRLDDIQFAIREKMGFDLLWVMPNGYEVVMPVESRGYFDWEKSQSIHCPEGAIGMALQPFNVTSERMSFMIVLGLV